jgi:hypothetical protein
MQTKPKKPASPDVLGATFHPNQPMPGAEAIEKDTHSAWALFQAIQDGTHDDFASTQHGAPDSVKARPRQVKPLTVEEVLFEARRNNRVCPMPSHWQKLHERLADLAGSEPPPLVSVTDWRATAPLDKRSRLRSQIEWAAEHRLLDPVFTFLRELPEEKWFHMGAG